MKSEAHGLASVYLINKTELNEEKYRTKFDQENIVGVKIEITTSDGKVHNVNAFLGELTWNEFINNKEIATKHGA